MKNTEETNKELMELIKKEVKYFSDELRDLNVSTLSEESIYELIDICNKVKRDISLLENLSEIASTLNQSYKDDAINNLKINANKELEAVDKSILNLQKVSIQATQKII